MSADQPMMIGPHKIHPAAAAFPLIEGVEFASLVDSVRTSGLREPVVYVIGKDTTDRWIIDGRNRLRALIELGIKPTASHFVIYRGADVDTYVRDKNIERRHLSESQRAMIAAALATLGRGRPLGEKGPIGPLNTAPTSIEDAARKMRVGPTSVKRARKVRETGAPEVIKAVMAGDLSLYAAERIASASKEEQAKEIGVTRDMRSLKKKALSLLAAGMGPHDVSSAVGVHSSTITQWSANPEADTRAGVGGRPKAVPDSEISRLFHEGLSVSEMVEVTNACRTTIGQSLKRLGLSRAGQRMQNPLGDHRGRVEISAETIEASTSVILAAASVSSREQVGELIDALNRLSKAVSNLKTRLNKEVGKED